MLITHIQDPSLPLNVVYDDNADQYWIQDLGRFAIHTYESCEGLLSIANRGTMFLDEIGELSIDLQSALLRVLENQTFRRLGEKEEKSVDVRFIFATNRDLQTEVEAGRLNWQAWRFIVLNLIMMRIVVLGHG